MLKWLEIFLGTMRSALKGRRDLVLENLALRQQLAVSMCRANPLWGAPRIHGGLLKLGIDVSETTVAKYMVKHRRPPSQVWRTFVANHAKVTMALDFFTVPTATFKVQFVLIILSHDRRRILHFNATEHPSAGWTARKLLEACGFDEAPRYLIWDQDAIYGKAFHRQARALKIAGIPTAPQSPWQNLYAECVTGSIRRECLDHMIILSIGISFGSFRIKPTITTGYARISR